MNEQITVKIVTEKPAIYDRLKARFKTINWDTGIAIVYGDRIFSKFKLPNDVLAHELVHVRQQAEFEGGASAWWDQYLEDDHFRFTQELEAYMTQVKYIREHTEETSREWRRNHIESLARDLSSPMYGGVISYKRAKELLK